MSKNKVVHFEIPADDFKEAKAFYEKVFDWKLNSMEDDNEEKGDEDSAEPEYLMAMTTDSDDEGMPTEMGGINGGFYMRTKKSEQPSIVVETDSIDDTLKKITKAGGKTTTPKHPIGKWGFMAEFSDPGGNEIGLWEKAEM